jgi:hypothetical protein
MTFLFPLDLLTLGRTTLLGFTACPFCHIASEGLGILVSGELSACKRAVFLVSSAHDQRLRI